MTETTEPQSSESKIIAQRMADRLDRSAGTAEKLIVGANIGGLLICLRVAENHLGPDDRLPTGVFVLAVVFVLGSASTVLSYFLDVLAMGPLQSKLLLISAREEIAGGPDDISADEAQWLQMIQRVQLCFSGFSLICLLVGVVAGLIFLSKLQ